MHTLKDLMLLKLSLLLKSDYILNLKPTKIMLMFSMEKFNFKLKQAPQMLESVLCMEGNIHSLLLPYRLLEHFWKTVEMFLKMLKWSFLRF